MESRTEPAYAVLWHDDYDGTYGIYKVFRDRENAVDYAADMVFERAGNLEVDVLDSDGWNRKMTRDEVRSQIAGGRSFVIVCTFREYEGGYREPDEYVEVKVEETEVEA